MELLRCVPIVGICLIAAAPVRAGSTRPMTTAEVAEAIAFGREHTVTEVERPYQVADISPVVTVETPFLRVARAAAKASEKAKAEYKPFRAPLVTEAMKAPVIQVSALILPELGKPGFDVKHIVIMPAGKTDRSAAIQPHKKIPMPFTAKNAAGARVTSISLTADFRMSVLSEGNEIRVVHTFFGELREVVIKLDAQALERLR